MREKTTILILTANPKNTDRLRIDEEVREIRDTLKSSSFRERFDVQDRLAVRPKDIQQALLDVQPQIVQFSGHGAQDGLMIENNSGEAILARPEALGNLFKLFPGQVECVFLNACFSQPQAEAIAAHVTYVIGMGSSIGDQTACEFATGFYRGLGAGKTIPEAFEFGRNMIEFSHLPEAATPVLLSRISPQTPIKPPSTPLRVTPPPRRSSSPFSRYAVIITVLIAAVAGMAKFWPEAWPFRPAPTPTVPIVSMVEATPTPQPEPTATPTKTPTPTPEPTSTPDVPKVGDIWKEPTTGMEFVYVPKGCFQMGSNDYDNEKPVHKVCLDGFWMGKYEVTQAQWEAVMKNNPSYFKGADRPVEQVSWNDAQTFLQKLNATVETHGRASLQFRLPSEAEWEYAARAGTTTPFYFGETISTDQANYDGNYTYGNGKKGVYRQQTTDVGSFPNNAFGLYDMHGNVWEWVADTWHDNYNGAPNDGSIWGDLGDKKAKVLRGGSWIDLPGSLRCAGRGRYVPDVDNYLLGFRAVVVSR